MPPVSYTHLDVYKRQSLTTGCGQSSSTEASNKENSSSEAAEAGTEAAAPVLTVWSDWGISDYFKDQGDAYYWKAIEEATGVDLQFIDSSGGKDALSILVGTDDLPDIIIEYDGTPVSYTHLDVYKRQVRTKKSSCGKHRCSSY